MPKPRLPALVPILLLLLLATACPPAFAAPPHQDATHVVQSDETLASIARRYGVTQQALAEANGLSNPSLIYSGQRLRIPGASAGTSQPAPAGTSHVVQPGETLTAIAARYGVSVAALAQANSIVDPSRIRSGQRLAIPAGGSAPGPAVLPVDGATYVVQPGDNLAKIARQHNTTVGALVSANGLIDPSRIYSGQQLMIPDEAAAPPAVVQSQGGLRVEVSISSQRCLVYQGEQLLYNWACSTGRAGAGTRTGTFYVQSKIQEAWGSAFGFYMPYWLGIYWAGSTENGIHGLPYTPGGQPIWANAVGTPVTYGCVLLGADESKTLWDMAYIGMPVTIRP